MQNDTGTEEIIQVEEVGVVQKSKYINNEDGSDEHEKRGGRATHGGAEVGVGDGNVAETRTQERKCLVQGDDMDGNAGVERV